MLQLQGQNNNFWLLTADNAGPLTVVYTESRNMQTGFYKKYRHDLRISVVITRTSKHHQDIVENMKSVPDLVLLRVYCIDNIQGSSVLQTCLDTLIWISIIPKHQHQPYESSGDIWKYFAKIIRNYRIKPIFLHCAPAILALEQIFAQKSCFLIGWYQFQLIWPLFGNFFQKSPKKSAKIENPSKNG